MSSPRKKTVRRFVNIHFVCVREGTEDSNPEEDFVESLEFDEVSNVPHLYWLKRDTVMLALQVMGIKVLASKKIAAVLFERFQTAYDKRFGTSNGFGRRSGIRNGGGLNGESKPPLPRHNVAIVNQSQFFKVTKTALAVYGYSKADHINDFKLALRVRSESLPFVVLIGGTSGTGKSTLASLVSARLGVTHVMSTDSIRNVLRSVYSDDDENDEKESRYKSILFSSTYNAAASVSKDIPSNTCSNNNSSSSNRVGEYSVMDGYKDQCDLIYNSLLSMVESVISSKQSTVIEGVHLSMDVMIRLIHEFKGRGALIPFLVCIKNEEKHKERFAVRAKYMTLEARSNRYVKYFDSIRLIQSALTTAADGYCIPKIDNTNVDRSLATIHSAIFECLRMIADGRSCFDFESSQATPLHEVFLKTRKSLLSSKDVLQFVQNKKDEEV